MKQLYTSYFARALRRFGPDPRLIAITARRPHFLPPTVKHLPELAPPVQLLNAFKTGKVTKEGYAAQYIYHLDRINKDPKVLARKIPAGSVLLCYEKTGSFCHRHLAAQWLMDRTDCQVEEL